MIFLLNIFVDYVQQLPFSNFLLASAFVVRLKNLSLAPHGCYWAPFDLWKEKEKVQIICFQSRDARLSQRETEQGLLFCCYYCCCHFSKQGKGEKLKIAFPVDQRRETIGRTGWTFFFVFCCFCLSCFYLCCAVLNKKETRKKCKFSFPTEMIKGRRR